MNNKLITLAHDYSSLEDFETRNFPKYITCKRKGLLRRMFPTEFVKPTQPLKGIILLYLKNRLQYITTSTIDCLQAIKDLNETTTFNWDNYVVYPSQNNADIAIISAYVIAKFKPIHNNNVPVAKPSILIENPYQYFNKAIKSNRSTLH